MDNNEFAVRVRETLGLPGDVVTNTDGVDTNTLALQRLEECVDLATGSGTLPAGPRSTLAAPDTELSDVQEAGANRVVDPERLPE